MSVHRHHPILTALRDPVRVYLAVALVCALAAIWTAVGLR